MFNTTPIAQSTRKAKQRFTYQCPACGSAEVSHDATATWDHDLQRFVLVSVQDCCICLGCEHQDNTGATFFKIMEA